MLHYAVMILELLKHESVRAYDCQTLFKCEICDEIPFDIQRTIE